MSGLLPGWRYVLFRNTKSVQCWIKYVDMLKDCAEKDAFASSVLLLFSC